MSKPKLGQILRAAKLIDQDQLKEAIDKANSEGLRTGEALIALGHCNEVHVAKALAKQHSIPFIDLEKNREKVTPELLAEVPNTLLEEFRIVPVLKKNNKLTVAANELLDFHVLDNLRFTLGVEVQTAFATRTAVDTILGEHMESAEAGGMYDGLLDEATITDIEQRIKDDQAGSAADAEDSNLIKLVNMLITDAIKMRASDIHVEPMETKLRIRYRIDGVCVEMDPPPKRLQGPILARLKIMSDMDIAERRKTQDGRIKMAMQGRDIDLRVSLLPTNHGESIVMRILDKQSAVVDLEKLGFHPTDYKRFMQIIDKPNGIFLVTGPTGSGKTTTLYAALDKLNKSDVKIITAENPIEYNFGGLNQCQVNHKIGLDFTRILRAMLRQAPNIILVGEIRDKETADIAIQAALTGHLVFSTLHTNDAPSALTRLIDMGVKPFLVSSAVQAVLAQRLLRTLCDHCKAPREHSDAELRMVGLQREDIQGRVLYEAVGCSECKGKGYKGRLGVYEMMEMTTELRDLTFQKASTLKLRSEARVSGGMLTLQEDGVRKLLDGKTTIDEILRVTHRDDV